MDVHQDTIAVAYVAQEPGAAGTSLGTLGTRQCDLDQLIRKMQAKATYLIVVYEAGPCGSWLYRYLRKKDYDCWAIVSGTILAEGVSGELYARIVRNLHRRHPLLQDRRTSTWDSASRPRCPRRPSKGSPI